MKKILIVIALFIVSLGVTVFVRRSIQPAGNTALPNNLGTAPRNIEILPSPLIKNDSPSQTFTNGTTPREFPSEVQTYSLTQQYTTTQILEIAGRLGFTDKPETTLEAQGLLSWRSGEKHLSYVAIPPSVKMTVPFTDNSAKNIPSPQAAESLARTFITSSGFVNDKLSLKLLQATYVNSDGLVFSPVTDPTKPTLVRVDFAYLLEGKPLYAQEGYPLGTTLLVSSDGVKMFMADLIKPEKSTSVVKIRPLSDALQLLEQGKGVLVDIEKRNTREGTTTDVSFSHFTVSTTDLGYIWNKETNQLFPCFVFSGTTQSGKDMGATGIYLVSGADIPEF